ncbi:hypothetical protein COCVIDRAFT_13820 [Bipolaris victoriae FI3]|uniref:Uncharacterized protein n=1 Tax=Bipolaris victoriae (strain FI3) TaxID=930091 RepID=W7F094_BIPV3|nr:hypothetical protein COCVIDRAFT_13820 [Bipolaris victoriae FI3]
MHHLTQSGNHHQMELGTSQLRIIEPKNKFHLLMSKSTFVCTKKERPPSPERRPKRPKVNPHEVRYPLVRVTRERKLTDERGYWECRTKTFRNGRFHTTRNWVAE